MSNDTGDSKVSVSDLKINAEIGISGIVKAAIEYTRKRCTNRCNAEEGKLATAGDYGAATAGDRGAATSRGKSCTGKHGLSVARGNNVKVRGGMGQYWLLPRKMKRTMRLHRGKQL